MSEAAGQAQVWTVGALLGWTQEFFCRSGLESPRLCAEILLAHVLGCERLRLYTRFEEQPDEAARTAFRDLVKRAAGGAPIAHLVRAKEFFSLSFEVTPDVLIPRPETEILVERVISLARQSPGDVRTIADIGVGSACIAVALARNLPDARLFASDISEAALAVARRNAAKHGVAERVEFRTGDLFAPWADLATSGALFDVVVCNPPYIEVDSPDVEPSVRDFEPHLALFAGADGLTVIRRLIAEAPQFLRAGGSLLFEMGYRQAPAVRKLVGAGWASATTYRDAAGYERVMHLRGGVASSQ